MQIAFNGETPGRLKNDIDILHSSKFGSVETYIVRGKAEDIKEKAGKYSPLLCDILPLTLEEIFIYELGGMGYEFENLLI